MEGGELRRYLLFADDLAATICREDRAFSCFSLCRINRTVTSSVVLSGIVLSLLIALFIFDVYFVYLVIGGGFIWPTLGRANTN